MYILIGQQIYCLLLSLETQLDVFYQVHIYKLDLSLYLKIHYFIYLLTHSLIDPFIRRISFDRFIVYSRASSPKSAV
jgi:hypothetical protein